MKDNTGTVLRTSLKIFNGNNLPHELLLTRRQKTKLRNAFNNNMSVDIKFSNAQISKIIQLMKIDVPLAKNVLAPLGITAVASALDTWFWKNNFNNFK